MGDWLFGSDPTPPTTTYVPPDQKIMPEPNYEANMRAGLTNWSNTILQNLPSMYSQYQTTQNGLMSGKLPTSFTNNMNNLMTSTMNNSAGQWLNKAGNNGVINSSVTKRALNDATNNVASASQQNFGSNLGMLENMNNNTFSNIQGLAQVPTGLYGLWRNSRYGLQGDTIVNPGTAGSPGLLGSVIGKIK